MLILLIFLFNLTYLLKVNKLLDQTDLFEVEALRSKETSIGNKTELEISSYVLGTESSTVSF